MSTVTQVKNYQGSNSFVIKMKETIQKYGKLTPAQEAAVQRILTAPTEAKQAMTEDMKKIMSYEGKNSFVQDIKSKLEKYGKLTEKQIMVTIKAIQKEENKTVVRSMNVRAEGDTIIISRAIGQDLKEKHGLKFNPVLIDLTRVLGFSEKAVKFAGKMTVKRGDVCMCCGRTLTDEFSMLTKMGKTCSKHMGVEYITDASQADRFREEYLKKVEEIGEMEFWIPKRQIKSWDGKTNVLMKMSKYWFEQK